MKVALMLPDLALMKLASLPMLLWNESANDKKN